VQLFVWLFNLDCPESRTEITGRFWNGLLEKDGGDQLDRSREKRRSRISRRVKEDRNILRKIQWKKTNRIGQISRTNRLLKRSIERNVEGRMEMRGRWGRRRRKLLDDLEGTENMLEIERGSTRSQSGGNLLKTSYRLRNKWLIVCTLMDTNKSVTIVY